MLLPNYKYVLLSKTLQKEKKESKFFSTSRISIFVSKINFHSLCFSQGLLEYLRYYTPASHHSAPSPPKKAAPFSCSVP